MAYVIGSKQIRLVIDQINDYYEYILQFLAENKMNTFKKSDVKDVIDIDDEVLSNFLSEMMELGIIDFHRNNETYKFSNDLYFTYFLIKSFEKNQFKNN